MKSAQIKNNRGFTLIELLVVIGILAVLLAITLIAINPARQFAQANDTKRSSDVNAILNAVGQYAADNQGDLSELGIPATSSAITSSGPVDICDDLVPQYIAEMPVDPQTGTYTDCTDYASGYRISQSSTDNRITVEADGEITPLIQVTR